MIICISFAANSLKMKLLFHIVLMLFCLSAFGQSNEFVGNGANIYIAAGAEVHVFGDFSISGGTLTNNGLIQTRGNSYSDNTFQQRGTGTYRIDNSDYNSGNRQFISGSFAVRGGQSNTGVNDGSFYNLELNNDQGIVYLVGAGYVADVRNSVDFQPGSVTNRIITHDVGETGAIVNPINGSSYSGTFGIMNPNSGIGTMLNNTVNIGGNMSSVDAGYIQGRLRRAIDPAGGNYEFLIGLEPAGAGAQRGFQLARASFGANSFDVISAFFFRGFNNSFPLDWDCGGYGINYFGGPASGSWYLSSNNAGATGNFDITIWPQDDNLTAHSVWVVTRNYQLDGTPDVCGPTPVGLTRTGYQDVANLGYFSLAAGDIFALNSAIQISATSLDRSIMIDWSLSEDFDELSLYRSENGTDFYFLSDVRDATSYEDIALNPHKLYYYKLIGNEGQPSENQSNIVVSSIQQYSDNISDVFVYPNPSSNDFNLTITLEKEQHLLLKITNSVGQVLSKDELWLNQGMNGIQFSANDWNSGVYFLEIRDDRDQILKTLKLIKQ